MKKHYSPSPWFRDIKWGEWLFFILMSGFIGWGGSLYVPGATRDGSIAAGVAAAIAAAVSFLKNPKALPWVEVTNESEKPE